MRISGSALGPLLVSTLLTGCGAPQSLGGAANGVPQTAAAAGATARGHSWMLPLAKTSRLLYVSSVLSNDVYAYSYSTQKLVGTLTGFQTPYGLCVDKAGNVWTLTMAPRRS